MDDAFDVVGLGALADERATATESAEQRGIQLGKKWLRALIVYAPDFQTLTSLLLDGMTVYIVSDGAGGASGASGGSSGGPFGMFTSVVEPLAERIESSKLDEADYGLLDELLHRLPGLRDPRLGAAMFKNDASDSNGRRVLSFVQMCAESFPSGVPALDGGVGGGVGAKAAGGGGGGGIGGDAAVDDAAIAAALDSTAFLQGDWLALNAAAKEWLHKTHAFEPETLSSEFEPAAPKQAAWYCTSRHSRSGPPGHTIISKFQLPLK